MPTRIKNTIVATAIATAVASLASPAIALPGDAGKGPVASPADTVGPNPKIAPV
jgi:hypothetical protein